MSSVLNCTGHELRIPNIVRGDGAHVFDAVGKRYVDLESGVWCTSLGHGDIGVNGAIKRQIDSIAHVGFCYSNDVVEDAARSVLSVSGLTGGKCVFLCSGSEAIELARQISRHLTKKHRSMTLHDSYLGSFSSLADRSRDWFVFDWEVCKACRHDDRCRKDCEHLQNIPDDISEFIFEPGSSSGFVRFPPASMIRNIVEIVRSNGAKVIANEVTTGIGRTGRWFGHNHYEIEPDLIAIGKGIGNGYPVSVTAMNARTVAQLADKPFKYMQSHQNDPLGAAVVRNVIKTIVGNDLIARAELVGATLLPELQELVDGETIVDVRGRGLMIALEFRDRAIGDHIYDELLDRGYIVCNRGSLFRIDPPLTIDEADLRSFTRSLSEILRCR